MSPAAHGNILLGLTSEMTQSGRLRIYFTKPNNHLVVAEPGSGKTRCVSLPNLICSPASMFVIDFKGSLTKKTAMWRAAHGQRVHVFDPFNVVDPKYLPHYNGKPCYAKVNGIDFIRAARSADGKRTGLTAAFRIAESFISPGNDVRNASHWADGGQNRFSANGMFTAFDPIIEDLGLPRNMATMWSFLSNPELEEASLRLMAQSEDAFIADQAMSFLQASEGNEEMSSIRSNIRTNCTKTFSEQCILDTMDETTIDFADMGRQPTTVYVVIPGDMASTHYRYVRYLMAIAFSQIEHAGVEEYGAEHQPIIFLCEEFNTLGNFPMIVEAQGRLREYGVKFITVVQNLSQLKATYGDAWGTICGNAGVIQYFGGTNDFFTAEELSKRCGTGTKPKGSRSQNARPGDGGSQTESTTPRAVYTPDEIMRLPLPLQIIKRSDKNPMEELLFDPDLSYFADWRAFQEIFERGDGLKAAWDCAQFVAQKQAQQPPVGVIRQQMPLPRSKSVSLGGHLGNLFAGMMGQEKPNK